MENTVLVKINGRVATLSLNRPKMLNSMNGQLVSQLHEALDQMEMDDSIRVIVLTGEGKGFCAGGDLSYLESLDSIKEKKDFIIKVGLLAKKIQMSSKPILAMVNGVAAGAGVNLMLACDLVYAIDTSRFAQSFSKVGLVPDCGGMYLLPKTIGIHKAKELMFTADLIDANKAYELGMINHICPFEELENTTLAMAEKLSKSAPLSLEFIKKTLNNVSLDLDDVLDLEASLQPLCLSTKDCKEGISAFKEKREPIFEGK